MLDQTCSTKLVWSSKFGRALLLRDQSVFPVNTNGIYMLDQTCSTKLVWSSKFSRALLLHDQCSTELFFLYIPMKSTCSTNARPNLLDQTSLVEQIWSSTTFARPICFSCKYQWNLHARPNLLDQTSLVEQV